MAGSIVEIPGDLSTENKDLRTVEYNKVVGVALEQGWDSFVYVGLLCMFLFIQLSETNLRLISTFWLRV